MTLPIESVLADLVETLGRGDAVLEAPPGAGKTTLVPLALAKSPHFEGRKILVLEPRRIAARAAAMRMSELEGESVGGLVGYRMRLDTVVGKRTRIEVVTEGVLARMLQDDPGLDGVGAVLFDEFHERSLEADLALAMTLKARTLFRDLADPLRLLVMSATLDAGGIAALLGDVPVVRVDGRRFPVDVVYGRPMQPRDRVADRVIETVGRALRDNPESNLLVFLPGQGEITRVAGALSPGSGVDVHPLYGNLSLDAQSQAIAPAPPGRRKIVLATNIAETSLTIDGVDVVVDSGLVREPVFDPSTAMTRLETRRISKSSATQRMGRAGRLRPGRCYRLWSAGQQEELAEHSTPEILGADLAPMAIRLLGFGVADPAELAWLDPPPAGAWQQALDLLENLNATRQAEAGTVLTQRGELMSSLPVHPRLGHLLVEGVEAGFLEEASLLASYLSDRDPFTGDVPDVAHRLEILAGDADCPPRYRGWRERTRQLARQLRERVQRLATERRLVAVPPDARTGLMLASAYPDRIARRRQSGGFQLANGRSADFQSPNRMSKSRWLAVAEVGGMRGRRGDVIRSAAPLDPDLFDSELAHLKRTQTVCEWDRDGRFVAEERTCIGSLQLSRKALDDVPDDIRIAALVERLGEEGLDRLGGAKAARRLQARVSLARAVSDLPDVSDEALFADPERWLFPWLTRVSKIGELKRLDLEAIISGGLTFDQRRELDRLVPERVEVPSAREVPVDYSTSPPTLAVKLQEMFGARHTPTILGGQLPLVLHLLSPAGRDLQVTTDLEHFWQEGYESVAKEMRGRYPKHPWPKDPLTAAPTRHTKKQDQGRS